MEPLIQSFTKNLSGCSGCGTTSAVSEFYSQKEKGDKVKFQLVVIVEADDVFGTKEKLADGQVISVSPYREPAQATGMSATQPQARMVAGSQFQNTQTQAFPQGQKG